MQSGFLLLWEEEMRRFSLSLIFQNEYTLSYFVFSDPCAAMDLGVIVSYTTRMK